MKQRIIQFIIMFAVISGLTACGKKEVVYDTEGAEGTSDVEAVQSTEELKPFDANAENPIADMIGVTDSYKWKDTIALDNGGSVEINAELAYYDLNQPVVVNTIKHSYSTDEKRRIVEYFFEKDSIEFDVDAYPTKEYYQNRMNEIDELSEIFDDAVEKHIIQGDLDAMLAVIDSEKAYMSDMYEEAPSKDELSKEIKDYSGNYYTGIRDGVAGSLVFEEDADGMITGFTYMVKNYNDVVKADSDVLYLYDDGVYSEAVADAYESPNNCTMTRDEVYEYTDSVIKALGIENVNREYTMDLIWEFSNEEIRNEGFRVVYGLDMDGIYYFDSLNAYINDGYVNSLDAIGYNSNYQIEMLVNDFGIIKMSVRDNLDIVDITPTMLLGYDKIKASFKEIIKNNNNLDGVEYRSFQYCYMRMIDEEKEGGCVYIPVWILDNYQNDAIVVNAIDGNEIDKETELPHRYTSFEEWEKSVRMSYYNFER